MKSRYLSKGRQEGFTLIELLGVIVLLTIIGLIVFKVIDSSLKASNQKAYDKQIEYLKLSAKNWASDHWDSLPTAGKSLKITLMTLKMGGYLEVDVSDPITKKCFSNLATIEIKNNGNTGLYEYIVDKDLIAENQEDCSKYTEQDTTLPQISISGEVSSLGYQQTANLTILYNYSNFNTNNITLKQDPQDNSYTSSEMSIGKESMVNSNGKTLYELKVKITGGAVPSGDVWLEIGEGAIKDNQGNLSEKVSSNKIKINNEPPKLTGTATTSTRTSCVGDRCNNIISGNEMDTQHYFCMDREGLNVETLAEYQYTANQYVDIKVEDNFSLKAYVYQKVNGTYKKISDNPIYSDNSNTLTYDNVKNGDYYFEICNVNDNCIKECNDSSKCETVTVNNKSKTLYKQNLSWNDCTPPDISDSLFNLADSDNLSTVIKDKSDERNSSSGVRYIYTTVSSVNDYLKLNAKNSMNFVTLDYRTYGNFRSLLSQNVVAVGTNYIYLTVFDNAGNKSSIKLKDTVDVSASDSSSNTVEKVCYYTPGVSNVDYQCLYPLISSLYMNCGEDDNNCRNQFHKDQLTICSGEAASMGKTCYVDRELGMEFICDSDKTNCKSIWSYDSKNPDGPRYIPTSGEELVPAQSCLIDETCGSGYHMNNDPETDSGF